MRATHTYILGAAVIIAAVALVVANPVGAVSLAANGKAQAIIVTGPDATKTEIYAAKQLAAYLKKITKANFTVTAKAPAKGSRIFVGQTASAKKILGKFDWSAVGKDGIVIKTVGKDLVLSGDRPRGSVYAVYTFLEDQLGVRWWTSEAEKVPTKSTVNIASLNKIYTPKLRCRETFFKRVMTDETDFPTRMKLNGHYQRIPAEKGGHYRILGFCHTFNQLLPPETYFNQHPEWYSLVNGKRSTDAQLCLTNPEMKAELLKQALRWIKADPDAGIISIAQNDWAGACQCENCKALVAKTGSESGALITFVNSVAEEIEKQYPDFLVETLAYQYTRKAPTNARPRDNVLIRLCSIECDFAQPVTASSNAAFYKDMQDWKKISKLLYIWDYTVNFSNLLIPHPNFQVLGDNLRTFVDNNAIGMFEQGDGYNPDAAFAPLKTWVISKLMWNPQLDEKALMQEFLQGYYGAAAPYLGQYIQILQDRVLETKAYLPCFYRKPGFYDVDTLVSANAAMQQALAAVRSNAELYRRVRIQNLALQHLLIMHKLNLSGTEMQGVDWSTIAGDYLSLSDKTGNTYIGEGSVMSEGYRSSLIAQASRPYIKPSAPANIEGLAPGEWADFQEDMYSLANEGVWVKIVEDTEASNSLAAVMPGDTNQWAVQLPLQENYLSAPAVEVVVSVKIKRKSASGPAFTFGVYDGIAGGDLAIQTVRLEDIADDKYHEYSLGPISLKPGIYVYIAPPNDGRLVESVSVDRIYLKAAK